MITELAKPRITPPSDIPRVEDSVEGFSLSSLLPDIGWDTIGHLMPGNTGVIISIILFVLFMWLLFKVWSFVERTFLKISRQKRPEHKRDSVRVFTKRQREEAMRRCNHRCEGTGLFLRCSYHGRDLHGDHWYPHARGGATENENLVMLCPTCNMKKSAKIPVHIQTLALGLRRKYHPDYTVRMPKPGKWLPRNYQNPTMQTNRNSLWEF